MALPEHLASLHNADAFPHPCGRIEVVETHISWVILTGEYVYKLKKPVRFPFVDFSTLGRREHFCREELRCNRAFAPALYLDVVPVVRDRDGRLRLWGDGEVVEWAVRMRQFPAEAQLDRLVASGGLEGGLLAEFGRSLAERHGAQPPLIVDAAELDGRVLAPIRANFDDIEGVPALAAHRPLLDRARAASAAQVAAHRTLLGERLAQGCTRECHGDLHLSNLVLLDGHVAAFDCLEFDPGLRFIDPLSDVAFLFMDCLVRGHADLAYGFLDGYLDRAGDYEGARLLPLYAAYRSMVRAKVAALRLAQAQADEAAACEQRFVQHLHWACDWLRRPPGRLVLMCGLSGSGKSFLAQRIAPLLPAVRLRSDVARKARLEVARKARPEVARKARLEVARKARLEVARSLRSDVARKARLEVARKARLEVARKARPEVARKAGRGIDVGLYEPARRERVYEALLEVAADLLASGEHVIVDATFLTESARQPFLARARALGSPAAVVYCEAPADILRQRIEARATAGGDPSDADLAVLERQRQSLQPPGEAAIRVDMRDEPSADRLKELCRQLTVRE